MYNEELKIKFIREYTRNIKKAEICEYVFSITEKFEKDWGHDVCTRGADELQKVVEALQGMRSTSKQARVVILKDYVRWCIDNGIKDACDGIFHTDIASLNKIKTQTVASPLQLQKHLNALFRNDNEMSCNNTLRCVYWLAFMGITEDEAFEIQGNDVDLDKKTLRHNGKELALPKESYDVFEKCVKLKSFAYEHTNPSVKGEFYRDRLPGDQLIRGTKERKRSSIRTHLSNYQTAALKEGFTTKKLSYYRVWLSGIFYSMYERECNGMPVDFTNVVEEQMSRRTYKVGEDAEPYSIVRKKMIRGYETDYMRWKEAHSL